MAKKLNFEEAKRKFKTDEEAANYFALVELYKKHLTGKQKEDFLSADTIDDMLKLLDDKQLRHLKQLVVALYSHIVNGPGGVRYPDPRYFDFINEAYSEWFRDNVLFRGVKESRKKGDVPPMPNFEGSAKLINKIVKHGRTKEIPFVKKEYESRLKRFDGNSVEYRQWLILLDVDNSIPNISKIYDVNKILKQLDIGQLQSLKINIQKKGINGIIRDMQHLEPYYYWLYTRKMEYNALDLIEDISSKNVPSFRKPDSYLSTAFEGSSVRLISKIDRIIEEKRELIELKIKYLVKSKTFETDVLDIARNIGIADDMILRNAIGDYSKASSSGSDFNHYLRKSVLLEKLREGLEGKGKSLVLDTVKFVNQISKVYEYFERHLLNKDYTVYRGIGLDGLYALLDTAYPKIDYDKKEGMTDSLIGKINALTPTVFEEGLTSTSLNKGVSSVEFGGKQVGGVLLTIKIPRGSKALVLSYQGIEDVPQEEEVLLAPKTKIKIDSVKEVSGHYEIEAEVVN